MEVVNKFSSSAVQEEDGEQYKNQVQGKWLIILDKLSNKIRVFMYSRVLWLV